MKDPLTKLREDLDAKLSPYGYQLGETAPDPRTFIPMTKVMPGPICYINLENLLDKCALGSREEELQKAVEDILA
jgi:hypothetical protein